MIWYALIQIITRTHTPFCHVYKPQLNSIEHFYYWANPFLKFSTLDSSNLFQHLGQKLFHTAVSSGAKSIITIQTDRFFSNSAHRIGLLNYTDLLKRGRLKRKVVYFPSTTMILSKLSTNDSMQRVQCLHVYIFIHLRSIFDLWKYDQ